MIKVHSSTFKLLRFHFSMFLMPIYWFAISQVTVMNLKDALLIFFILHVLIYPSSNGYNSYMDRDTGSIGGIEKPPMPSKQLLNATVIMDMMAILLSLLISLYFTVGVVLFIAASKAYSYRNIRLKKFPVWGYLTVVIFQGALIYAMVFHGSSDSKSLHISWPAMAAASFLIGAFYPLTQIYQHRQDAADGVKSMSALLGYRGTFLFSAILFIMAMGMLAWYFGNNLELDYFFIIQLFMLPALVYFFWWMQKVFTDETKANYRNTMNMNLVGSICSNAAFISIFLIEKL